MRVRDLPLQPVLATTRDETLADAADRMRFYEIGALAVMERREIVAIVTERDIVRAVADRSDLEHTPVLFYMTSEPVQIDIDADVIEAAVLMLTLGVRHLPVVDQGRIAGMISIRDLLAAELDLAAAQPKAR